MNSIRQIIFYKTYFLEFYNKVNIKVQEKIDFALEILATQHIVPQSHVKYIENSDGIYEIRVSVRSDEYRILFFFEDSSLIEGGNVVILGNGFIKKDKKDYRKAVSIAEKIKKEYLEENGL
jgi:hypothetical protein